MRIAKANNFKGFTLIELLISITLGISAVSAIMFFYISTVSSSYTTLKSSRLNQEMGTLMTLMVNDLRRAGFNSGATNDPSENIFSNEGTTKLSVDGSCILFAYDHDTDGKLDNNDYSGFKLLGGEAFIKTGAGDCEGSWGALTDKSDFTITTLSFDLSSSMCLNTTEPDGIDQDGSNGIDDYSEYDCYSLVPGSGDYPIVSGETVVTSEVWVVDISLEAQLTDDTDVKVALEQTVQVRNPHIAKVTL